MRATSSRALNGLVEVVIGAQFETVHAIRVVVARGQHQHRQVRIAAQTAQHIEAAEARHGDVEQHDIRRRLINEPQRRGAIVRERDLELFLREVLPQHGAHFSVVIDDEYA